MECVENQAESVHGHEVLHMILASDEGYTREDLLSDMEKKFGAQARFHTCSASGMNGEELLAFLEERGKFLPSREGRIQTEADRICNH
jgi:probable metal-binding protein